MPYIILNGDGSVIDCTAEALPGYHEITSEQAKVFRSLPRHDLVKFIDGEFVRNDELYASLAVAKALEAKKRDLANLEVQMARALLWLVKLLVQKGTIQASDIPQPLRDLRTRIEALQSEIG